MSFQGFEDSDLADPKASTSQINSSSNSEASDYETGTDKITTPIRSRTPAKITTVVKKKQGTSVRQLIEHFSSDSDTAAEQLKPHRRRRSATAEHIEIPAGGEKQLRKEMAEQRKAEGLVNLHKAMQEELIASMDEVDIVLASEAARDLKLGHLASINTQYEDLDKYWGKIEESNDKPGVEIEFFTLVLLRNKVKARYSKLKAQLIANTEAATPAAATPTVRIVNPTSFGNLALPQFSGDYVEFDNYEATFRNLINNGNLDEGGKLAHLLHNLKGEARDYIGRDGLASKTYEDVWTELRARYGKPWRITRAAVKKVIDLKDPEHTPQDITRYWNQVNESCKVAERLKLTATSVILNMALLKLPVEFRSKMDDKLKAVSEKYVLTRELVAEPFNDVIAGEVDKPSNIVATLGFNTTTAQANKASNASGQPAPQQTGRSSARPLPWCMLCPQRGHKAHTCPKYTSGPLVAERLRILGRCMRCGVPFLEHGQECSHRVNCKHHPGQRHLFYACDTFTNFHHVPQPPRPMVPPARPIQPPNRMIRGGPAGRPNS